MEIEIAELKKENQKKNNGKRHAECIGLVICYLCAQKPKG